MGTSGRPIPRRCRPTPSGLAPLAVALAVILAACGTTQSAAPLPTAAASSPAAPAPAASPASGTGLPSASAAPTAPAAAQGGTWAAAGTLGTPRLSPHLVALGDGRVLAVGNDGICVEDFAGAPDDGTTAELWDPATGTWSATAPLNTPRANGVALALADGRALVAGGANAGRWDKHADQLGSQSYSSAWTFDPRTATWTKTGLMRAARTGAASAVLPDGRVLVAGGYFTDYIDASKYPWLVGSLTEPRATLARFSAGTLVPGGTAPGPPADVAPPNAPANVLATAELFDPATGTWSSTGSLAVPRYDASAVRLADGRILVASVSPMSGVRGYELWTDQEERAQTVAEVYDPAKGRFQVTGEFPADWLKFSPFNGGSAVLVALGGGGALLVGGYHSEDGLPSALTLRYDPGTNQWTQTGNLGTARAHPVAVTLASGKVLVAGGEDAYGPTATAEIYDPATGAWSPAPSMPGPRIGGAAAVLADGSVLVAGGYAAHSHQRGDSLCPQALAGAVRFVPAP